MAEDPMKDPYKKVIDFDNVHRMEKRRKAARKRNLIIVTAIIAAVVLFVLTFLFLQAREVVSGKDFWQNFNSSQQER